MSWRCNLLLGLQMASLVSTGQAEPFIESEVTPANPYVQQQILYTQSLYRDSHIQAGDFLRPDITGALMVPLEPRPPKRVTINGKEQEVVRQRYLLFPLQAGTLSLPAPVYSSRSLYVAGDSIDIDVQPLPVTSQNPLVVTPQLRLSERWNTPDLPWQPGDHLERVITIEADQVTGAQLPRVKPQPIDGMQIQRLQGQVSEALDGDRLTGKRVERLLYIPEESGDFNVAPIEVAWWDVSNERLSSTVIPSKVLEVRPTGMRPQSPLTPPDSFPLSQAAPATDAATKESGTLLRPILAALALAILIILIARYSRIVEAVRIARLSLSLRKACRTQNPRRAKELLDQWAKSRKTNADAFNLLSLSADQHDPTIQKALIGLDRALYSGRPTAWAADESARPLMQLMWSDVQNSHRPQRTMLPALWGSESTPTKRVASSL